MMAAQRLTLAALAATTCIIATACASSGSASVSSPDDGTVRIAAASDLTFALEEIAGELHESHSGLDLAITYGSSGTFLQQLMNGAPFDLYLSADLDYPRELVADGLASEEDVFAYAVGRLALWAASDSPVDPSDGLPGLVSSEVDTIAIANPEHAPYGVAAVAAMKSAGIYEAVADKLIFGENVAQAAEFAMSGNADAGLIALSLALSPAMSSTGSFVEIPLDDYPRIDQGGVVMASARDPEAAHLVRDYLVSDEGEAILARHGFSMPPSPAQ